MNNSTEFPLNQVLGALTETRRRLSVIEASWKEERAVSRRLTIQLITEHGYSINKAAMVSGHQRNTITTWLAADGFQVKG